MKRRERWAGPDAEYIVPLYRLLKSNVPTEKVMDWMAINGMRHSNQMVKRTLKMAGREDLLEYIIKEEEIKIGDIIKSRMTAREGKVVGIRPDGDTIEVKWDTGGRQLLSKESVFKLRSKEIVDHDDVRKVCTDKDETYKNMEKPKLYQRSE